MDWTEQSLAPIPTQYRSFRGRSSQPITCLPRTAKCPRKGIWFGVSLTELTSLGWSYTHKVQRTSVLCTLITTQSEVVFPRTAKCPRNGVWVLIHSVLLDGTDLTWTVIPVHTRGSDDKCSVQSNNYTSKKDSEISSGEPVVRRALRAGALSMGHGSVSEIIKWVTFYRAMHYCA